ncbi:MAG: hypothetical protein LBT71_01425 [Azoarcus sp.]|jgi:hypothetical protein|nr:hypothetical protein [Azoarcus sp.]
MVTGIPAKGSPSPEIERGKRNLLYVFYKTLSTDSTWEFYLAGAGFPPCLHFREGFRRGAMHALGATGKTAAWNLRFRRLSETRCRLNFRRISWRLKNAHRFVL